MAAAEPALAVELRVELELRRRSARTRILRILHEVSDVAGPPVAADLGRQTALAREWPIWALRSKANAAAPIGGSACAVGGPHSGPRYPVSCCPWSRTPHNH